MSNARFRPQKTACLAVFVSTTLPLAPAQTFKTLVNFNGTNGAQPQYMSLIQATDGSLYGTTNGGGAGSGTVFRVTRSGVLTTLYSFHGPDGANPSASVVQGSDGSLYGTTSAGGANNAGTVFKVTLGGKLTTLHEFSGTDGAGPVGGLVQATDGNFYGTTSAGGADNQGGTIFRITPAGTLTTLASLGGFDASPLDSLIQGTDGLLYGTSYGNIFCCGVVFRISLGGVLRTLHVFQEGSAELGQQPYGSLVQATDGNFYGTTKFNSPTSGTVFAVTPSGTLMTLHSFTGSDGSTPLAGLIQATDGKFYGVTSQGGANNDGTLFQLTPGRTLTTLHTFAGSDGSDPIGGLLQDTDGAFYGATQDGGSNNMGTIFVLSTGLRPFVKAAPSSGEVGANVQILGTDLTGAGNVTFNGTPAVYTVASPTLISATVPVGATTGKIQVATLNGTLSSNLSFRVVR